MLSFEINLIKIQFRINDSSSPESLIIHNISFEARCNLKETHLNNLLVSFDLTSSVINFIVPAVIDNRFVFPELLIAFNLTLVCYHVPHVLRS